MRIEKVARDEKMSGKEGDDGVTKEMRMDYLSVLGHFERDDERN